MTLEDKIAKAIGPLLAEIKTECFTPEYAPRATDAEALGLLLAKYTHWDGEQILDAAAAALEDANWHDASELVGAIHAHAIAEFERGLAAGPDYPPELETAEQARQERAEVGD